MNGRSRVRFGWLVTSLALVTALAVGGEAAIDEFIAKSVITHHHPCGTCRMGSDEDAVVGPDLRLKALGNLSVVDASIMPSLTAGPIHAAVLAIAESFSRTF